MKFIKFYLLKRQIWLQHNYYVHKKILIIVNNSAKQLGFIIKGKKEIKKCDINYFWQIKILLNFFTKQSQVHENYK
jgi:hypothetical protein